MRDYELEPMMRPQCSYCKLSQNVMPDQYSMPQYDNMDELEEMYPRIFHLINPHVRHHCHRMEMIHGRMHHYLKEEIDDMCEQIYGARENEIDEYMKEDDHDYDHEHEHSHDHNHDHRQFGHQRNRFGMDLIRILLLRELLERRRRHPHPRPYGYYNQYPYHRNMY